MGTARPSCSGRGAGCGHAALPVAEPPDPGHSAHRTDPVIRPREPVLSASSSPAPLDGKARLGLTLIAGGAVANIYYNQPLLGLIVAEFGEGAALWVPTTALVGYGLGIVALVPLGDALPRRRLIVLQCLAMALALLAVGLSGNLVMLALAHLLVGVLASAAQQAVPFAAELAPDATRGRIVGQVMTGLFTGILLARTVSGFLGAHLGWRPVFLVASGVALAMAGVAAATLPHTPQTQRLRYRALMVSIIGLARSQPVLRTASLSQGLLFASFNAFWATLALQVEGPAFGLSAAGAGLFGVIGVCGAIVAPLSGRFTDKRGARPVVLGGSLLVVLSFLILWAGGSWSLVAIAIGVLLIDIGINSALIANQTRAYALVAGARGRINTVLFTTLFAFASLGAYAGSRAFLAYGWPGVCAVGLLCSGLAVAVSVWDFRKPAKG
ncbi:MFS transporter [Methylobacterium aerolatum]|uniref:MFS family arabinose efflux permease n=1 Tax=Methylobacterium aerolatum TaxID=418708 RepID=A0ABU0I1M3_9HYPH|nr:MFS transporter [Methylobacterium aerolatum]MDQ0448508.1 putative MFS family arabinose efflux permease [Methylobacterium aerolatum]GJD33125.1 putative transporter [Methylobacterium aerolatum]